MILKILCCICTTVVTYFLSLSVYAEKMPNDEKNQEIESKENNAKNEGEKHHHLNYEYGVDLTPMGAEKAGNREGTIPPWTGGIKTPPANYKIGMHHPDPFSDDKILFTISAENMEKYKDTLSPGQRALLEKKPSFKMQIYQTRRSASLPQRIYEATIANEKTAKLTNNRNSVANAIIGIPFPVPENGHEAIWNHILRYRGDAVSYVSSQAAVTVQGDYTLGKMEEEWYFPYHQEGATPESINNKIYCVLDVTMSPPSIAGVLVLFLEPLDYGQEPRNTWAYYPGQRRVARTAEFNYDLMPAFTEGLRSADQYDMYNGAIDRYDWKLAGKKELFVPYNSYKLHSDSLKYKDIVKPLHINADYARYELHRVWVVDATLKKGMKHIYPRRTFYLDEDSWQILIIDYYDTDGNIWRVSEGHVINYYEVPVLWTTLEVHYDLKSGRYYVMGLDNEERMYDFSIKRTLDYYTPAKLRKLGKR